MATGKGTASEIKTQFCTKEGRYKLLQLSDYSRPIRQPNNAPNIVPVRLSFVTVKDGTDCEEKIAFNAGKDMFLYNFRGLQKAPDLTRPLDRRSYKGAQPTCHDVNQMTRKSDSIEVLVGFTGGQIQLMDPLKHECINCFNEERTIDKCSVTCIKWVPGTENVFVAAHSSGNLYVYNKENPVCNGELQYTTVKRGLRYSIDGCRSKTPCNPLFRWVVGKGAIHEVCFSPDCKHLAIVSQDGYLRIFDYEKQDIVAMMRSYFGGLLCVCWSPDGKYIVTGGEDDLITVWSFDEKRVIARGEGHRSWVNVVAFDPYTTQVDNTQMDDSDDDDMGQFSKTRLVKKMKENSIDNSNSTGVISYRFGSVGDDTQLLLWDLSEDVLKPPKMRTRSVRVSTQVHQPLWTYSNSSFNTLPRVDGLIGHESNSTNTKTNSLSRLGSKQPNSVSNYTPEETEDLILGNNLCPRMDEIPNLEPLVCKKISSDRLSSMVFREDCIVTACYEGYVHVWGRPEPMVSKTPIIPCRREELSL